MPKPKSVPAVVTYVVAMKNRKEIIVQATSCNLDNYTTCVKFSLHGQLVFMAHAQKWDYIKRVTDVPEKQL
jgi:hypothetical protein